MTRDELDLALPAPIPADEAILWQGRPDWRALARRAFRIQWVAGYFALLALWSGGAAALDGLYAEAGIAVAKTAGLAALGLGVISALAWLSARTSLYVITSRRVVMKVGVALPVFFNLPFASIASAGLARFSDGSGDVSLGFNPHDRIAYLHLWPHARPGHFTRPEPSLRAVADASGVAEILGRALIAAHEGAREGAAAPRVRPARAEPAGVLRAARAQT